MKFYFLNYFKYDKNMIGEKKQTKQSFYLSQPGFG